MGKKIFFLFTFILFHLTAIHAEREAFPFKGGMTSDSIEVRDVAFQGFHLGDGNNSIQVENNESNPKMTFSVSVPEGKEAVLQFKVLLKMMSKRRRGNGRGNSDNNTISFTVIRDNEIVLTHRNTRQLCYKSDQIKIPSGKSKISLEAKFEGSDYTAVGSIDSLTIHVHRFSKVNVIAEVECGKQGEKESKCDVCGKDTVFTINPARSAHHFAMYAAKQGSCMGTSSQVTKCEYCPHTEIVLSTQKENHQFDGTGKCTVCGLRRPNCNADSTVYEINDAGEMRVLAELMSIGKIPGNIGININNDLEFSSDLPMEPLGTFDHPFQGVLNGNGHRIRGVVNYYQGVDGLGFVGVAKGTILLPAVIANLIFDNGNTLGGSACVGGIVGHATYCNIVNCASFGALEGTNHVGGIVGYASHQVSIVNCASVTTISTEGTWNPLACDMPWGQIYNSYGAATNDKSGMFDELKTTTLRHCFSTVGSGDGLRQVSRSELTSENMIQALNEESETKCFDFSPNNLYPVPVVNSTIITKSNGAVETRRSAEWRRALAAADGVDETSEKDYEIIVLNGLVDEGATGKLGYTVEEVKREDSTLYANLDRVYIAMRRAPEKARLYEPVSGGDLLAFESYYISEDSVHITLREYDLVSPERVKAAIETVNSFSGEYEYIDEYTIGNGDRRLLSRITIESDNRILYQENMNGILRPIWSIETSYDDSGNATVTNGFSHNYRTGEAHLEYSYTYDDTDPHATTKESSYEEYVDSVTNTIHVIYNTIDPATGKIISREHYILRASDQFLLEVRTEKMVGDEAYLVDGIYFIYDDEGNLVQSVTFGPVDENDPNSEIRLFAYFDYEGAWKGSPYPTAIEVPTVERHSISQKRMDPNVYDMQGRMVRKAADVKDPFNGLPRGIYIYQGVKYLKK